MMYYLIRPTMPLMQFLFVSTDFCSLALILPAVVRTLRLVQCMGHPKPPCDLLILLPKPDNYRVRDYPSAQGTYTLWTFFYSKNFTKFTIQGTHIGYKQWHLILVKLNRIHITNLGSRMTVTSLKTATAHSMARYGQVYIKTHG